MTSPKKSILKRPSSSDAPTGTPELESHYATVTGTEGGKFRQVVENLMRKSQVLKSDGVSNGSLGSVGNLGKKVNVVRPLICCTSLL